MSTRRLYFYFVLTICTYPEVLQVALLLHAYSDESLLILKFLFLELASIIAIYAGGGCVSIMGKIVKKSGS